MQFFVCSINLILCKCSPHSYRNRFDEARLPSSCVYWSIASGALDSQPVATADRH